MCCAHSPVKLHSMQGFHSTFWQWNYSPFIGTFKDQRGEHTTKVSWIKVQQVFHMINSSVSFRLEDNRVVCLHFCLHVSREASVSDVCASVADLWDVVDGGLHAAELWRLDVEHLQDIVGQRVDQVGYAGQRLGSVVLGLLQRPLLVWRLSERKERTCLKHTVYLHFTVCNRRPSVVHTERGG